MSDVLLIQGGQMADVLLGTSIVKKLTAEGHKVHCITDKSSSELLSYCKNVKAETVEEAKLKRYDTAINLSPMVTCTEIMEKVDADTKVGYGKSGESLSFYNKGAELHYRHRYVGVPTRSNLFQLTYGLAGMTWHGEGYYVNYFPRNRSKGLTGLAIRDSLLRDYVGENVSLSKSKLSVIPFRINLLKQIDELNRCRYVVTDDAGIMHLALALRKSVEFIVRKKPPYRIEMFGSGHIHVFDSAKLKDLVYS